MKFKRAKTIKVSIWGNEVGVLSTNQSRRGYLFEYTPEWKSRGIELAPILMPLSGERIYSFGSLNLETWQGLPPMIADSLPDDFGNALINAWMAQHGFNINEITPLDRLAYLGKRGMGALEFQPDQGPKNQRPHALDMSELVIAARAAVAGDIADEAHAHAILQQIINVGTSAGGQRAKAIVNLDPETNEIKSGHLQPELGFEPWLVKFDGVGEDRQLGNSQVYGRTEYAYSLMAKAAGITMAPTRLLEENGRAHFITRRFDRNPDGSKVHMQSLCALAAVDFRLRGTNDYSQLLVSAKQLNLDKSAETEILRRAIFNYATMNCDDHSKNFAFMLPAHGDWQLTPAYDVTFAYNPSGEWNNQHLMSLNGKFMDIHRKDIVKVADDFEIPGAVAAIKRVVDAVKSWPQFAKTAGLSAKETDEIGNHFNLDSLSR